MDFIVTDADAVRDLIPVVIRVQTVASLRLLEVIQLSIAAGQMESGLVVGEVSLPTIYIAL